ncbi:MAG: hypothetical protein M1167_05675 [Chloroflexi bacterium]|nr:hypothetical protein [Chloroflexota bacterium]
MSFLQDIVQVIYAPHKVFKKIVSNPKYLGALIILLLFIGIQIGYEYEQFSKTYTEQTYPAIYFNGADLVNDLPAYTNATAWTSSANVNLTNTASDYFNYSIYLAGFGVPPTSPDGYSSLFGNTSLQMEATNTGNLMAALGNTSNVDCSATGFQNISMTIKQVEPQSVPLNATLTLYSLSDTDSYSYNIAPMLSNTSTLGQWDNLTIPVGPNAQGWTTSGAPTWSNITSLVLNFSYPSDSNITLRVGALYFRGQYITPVQYGSLGLVIQFLQVYSLQFIFTWFVLTGLIYAFCRFLFKNTALWKPLFTALAFAMFVMVIRGLVNLAAAAALQTTYYPFDISLGVRFDQFASLYFPPEAVNSLMASSQAAFSNIEAATSLFRGIVTVMSVVSYIWLGALGVFAIGALKPEFSMGKRITLSVASLAITIFVVLLLVGVV